MNASSPYQLHFCQGSPPDAGVSGLKLGHSLVEEVDEVGVDRLQDGDRRHRVEVGSVPLVQQRDVVAHCHLLESLSFSLFNIRALRQLTH